MRVFSCVRILVSFDRYKFAEFWVYVSEIVDLGINRRMKQKMDKSKKLQINQWVEDSVYTLLEQAMAKRQITATDAATMTPFIQMYQAMQLENVCSELDSLWRLLTDGDASIRIPGEVDVNVKGIPQDGPQQPKRGR